MTSNLNSQNKNEKIHVNSYTRKDGTEVDDYLRRRPNSGIVEPDKNYPDTLFNEIPYDKYGRTVGDALQEDIYLNKFGKVKDKYGKSMTEFLLNAANDFEMARNDKNAIVYKTPNEIPNANLRKFLTEDRNITNNGQIDMKNMEGAYYNSNSNVAKSISNEYAIRNYIKMNKTTLVEYGKQIDELNKKIPKGGEKYYANAKVATATIPLTGYANIGDILNCTLYNPHIDKNGHFKAQLIDIVDYDPKKDELLFVPNSWGYKMQQNGRIKKVFHVVDIDIPDV